MSGKGRRDRGGNLVAAMGQWGEGTLGSRCPSRHQGSQCDDSTAVLPDALRTGQFRCSAPRSPSRHLWVPTLALPGPPSSPTYSSSHLSFVPPVASHTHPMLPQHACQHTHFMGQPAGCFAVEVIGGTCCPISAPPPGTLPGSSSLRRRAQGEERKQSRPGTGCGGHLGPPSPGTYVSRTQPPLCPCLVLRPQNLLTPSSSHCLALKSPPVLGAPTHAWVG